MPLVSISAAQRAPVANANFEQRSITGCRLTCILRPLVRAAVTLHFSGAFRRKKASTVRLK
jgi:hypothetical protein